MFKPLYGLAQLSLIKAASVGGLSLSLTSSGWLRVPKT
jgi:hypothetical protein